MLQLFLFALLVRHDDVLPPILSEMDGSAGLLDEMLRRDLPTVDEAQSQPFGNDRPEFFHQVQPERGPSRAQRMEKSHLRVEADALGRGYAIRQQQRVQKREQRVCRVARRTSSAAVERKRRPVLADHTAERTEVLAGSLALHPAEFIQVFHAGKLSDACRQFARRCRQGYAVGGVLGLACRTQHDLASVLYLAGYHVAGERQRSRRIGERVVLRFAQQDVARNRPFQAGLEPPGSIQKDDGPTVVGATVQHRGAHQYVAEAHDAAQMVQRHLKPGLAFDLDAQGFVIEPHVGFGRGHVQGVEKLAHAPPVRPLRSVDRKQRFPNVVLHRFAGHDRRETRILQRAVHTARIVHRRRQGRGRQRPTDGDYRLRDFFAEGGREVYDAPAPGTMVEDRPLRNVLPRHFFEAQGLGAELQVVVFLLAPRPVFVFDGVGRGAVELDDVGPTGQPQRRRPKRQGPFHADAFLDRVLGFVHLPMHGPAPKGVQVLVERLLLMNQGALPRTVAIVLQGGDHDEIVVRHGLVRSGKETAISEPFQNRNDAGHIS